MANITLILFLYICSSFPALKRSTFVKYMRDGAIKIFRAATNLLSSEITIMIPTLNVQKTYISLQLGRNHLMPRIHCRAWVVHPPDHMADGAVAHCRCPASGESIYCILLAQKKSKIRKSTYGFC